MLVSRDPWVQEGRERLMMRVFARDSEGSARSMLETRVQADYAKLGVASAGADMWGQ